MSEKTLRVVNWVRASIYVIGFISIIIIYVGCFPPETFLITKVVETNIDRNNLWPPDLVPHVPDRPGEEPSGPPDPFLALKTTSC